MNWFRWVSIPVVLLLCAVMASIAELPMCILFGFTLGLALGATEQMLEKAGLL